MVTGFKKDNESIGIMMVFLYIVFRTVVHYWVLNYIWIML